MLFAKGIVGQGLSLRQRRCQRTDRFSDVHARSHTGVRSRRVDRRVIRFLAIVGIPAAVVLHGYVGFLFGAVKANPWWSTALMPVVFLVSAIVSGIAVLTVLYLFLSWKRGAKPNTDCVRTLARYLWLSLMAAVTLELLELIHMAYEAGEEWHVIRELLTTRLATSYGVVQLLIGSLCPFVLLAIATRPRVNVRVMSWLSAVSGLLILVQVFAMRWNVVVGGQLFSKSFRGFVDYPLHIGGREGLIAAAIVLVLPFVALAFASRILPLLSDQTTVPPSRPKEDLTPVGHVSPAS